MTAPRSRWRLWRAPLGLAVVSLAGLVSALVGDDLWDVASWFALGLPLATALWFGLRRRPPPRHD